MAHLSNDSSAPALFSLARLAGLHLAVLAVIAWAPSTALAGDPQPNDKTAESVVSTNYQIHDYALSVVSGRGLPPSSRPRQLTPS